MLDKQDAATNIEQKLCEREKEVLKCLSSGMNNQEIATELYLSTGTVKNYVSSILSKLEVRDRVGLVLYALKAGI